MEVTAFESTDGTLFRTKEEALHHNKDIEMKERFNKLYSEYSVYGEVKFQSRFDLMDMVKNNKELFQWILEEVE